MKSWDRRRLRAGKSVLLHSILGLRRPQAARRVLRPGHRTAQPGGTSRHVRSYGVTFQNGALISSLTVAQNIQLPLRESYSMSEDALDELVQLT